MALTTNPYLFREYLRMTKPITHATNPHRTTEHYERVKDFMHRARQATPIGPSVCKRADRVLRAKLIFEEALETCKALKVEILLNNYAIDITTLDPRNEQHIRFEVRQEPFHIEDLVGVMDGCADIMVVTTGTLITFGLADVSILECVDKSNLAKFTGDGHRSEDGKWIKPTDWQPPDLFHVLECQVHTLPVPAYEHPVLDACCTEQTTGPTYQGEPIAIEPEETSTIGPATQVHSPENYHAPAGGYLCNNCRTPVNDEIIKKMRIDRLHVGHCPNCRNTLSLIELINTNKD